MDLIKVNKVLTFVLGCGIIATVILSWELWTVIQFQATMIRCTPDPGGL